MRVAVAGYGAVGRTACFALTDAGHEVLVLQRKSPPALSQGMSFRSVDATDAESLVNALRGCDALVCAVGVNYSGRDFLAIWPRIAAAMLEACAATGARFVLADNLYMYGPQTAPLREDMPLTDLGQKPRARAKVTRLWQEAHRQGRVLACAVRASDFYGPGAGTSVLTMQGIAPMLRGKAAMMPFPVDHPHSTTYVPDFAQAIRALLEAPEADYGQAWHVPNAPAETWRALLHKAAGIAGATPRIRVMPDAVRRILGVFVPILAELGEMRFQWDRPYIVDDSRFCTRFGLTATPHAEGLATTVAALRAGGIAPG